LDDNGKDMGGFRKVLLGGEAGIFTGGLQSKTLVSEGESPGENRNA